MKKIFIFAVAILLITSCITQQKRADIAYRHFRENPGQLAELCALNFPSKTTYLPGSRDTLYAPGRTDTLFVDCPPDSSGNIAKVPCPPCTDTLTIKIQDTLVKVDDAALAAIRANLIEIRELSSRQAGELKAAKGNVRTLTLWLLGVALFAVIGWVIAMRRGLF